MNISLIEALLLERKGLVARGLKDRVKAVDEQLSLLGYKAVEVAAVEPEAEQATAAKPRRRKVS